MESLKVRANEANFWVTLDGPSGGYPYATEIEQAHDFGSVDKARAYARGHAGSKGRCVLVKYEVVA